MESRDQRLIKLHRKAFLESLSEEVEHALLRGDAGAANYLQMSYDYLKLQWGLEQEMLHSWMLSQS